MAQITKTQTTKNPTTVAAARPVATRGFVALLLLTAGALLLAGRALPIVGDALALVLGIELLVWAFAAREDGLLVTGGVTAGLGAGVLLAAGPLLGAEPHTVGATFLLGLAGGFGLIAGLALLWWRRTWPWAWVTAAAVGAIGAGLLGGADRLGDVLTWGLPAALLVGGVATALWWRRA
jgi:hypothetical protein